MKHTILQAMLISAFLIPSVSIAACVPVITRSLQAGSSGAEVLAMQKILNADKATRIAISGLGSPGRETTYFGSAVREAVKKFQAKHITPGIPNFKPTGTVGPVTRKELNRVSCTGDTTAQKQEQKSPVIVSVYPPTVYAGDTITLNGLNLSKPRTITMHGNSVGSNFNYIYPPSMIVSSASSSIVLRVPDSLSKGEYLVTVESYNQDYLYGYQSSSKVITVRDRATSGQSSSSDSTLGAPVISSVNPSVITPGGVVMISGENFGDIATTNITISSNAVGSTFSYSYPHFSDAAGMVMNATDKLLKLRTPEVKAGDYLITVQIYNPKYLYGYQSSSKVITVRDKEAETISAAGAPIITTISPSVINQGGSITISGENFGDIATTNITISSNAVGSTFSYSYPHFSDATGMVMNATGKLLKLRTPEVKAGDYLVTIQKYNPNYAYGWQATSKLISIRDKSTSVPLMNTEEDYAMKCASGIYPSIFSICKPAASRLSYLIAQFAKAPKPMSNEFVNSFGPGFADSEKAFSDWVYVHKGPTVYSCDDAVVKFGLFGGDKSQLGNWRAGSNRDFYNDGKFIGSGGVAVSSTQWNDKAGNVMVEPSVAFDAVGYCQHN